MYTCKYTHIHVRVVRLLSKPKWFPLYLNDIIFTGELDVCKFLPRPEMVFLPSVCQKSSRWQEWQQLTTTAKRQRIAEAAEEQYNPKQIDDALWQRLRMNTLSLPSCLRPGKHAR